MTGSVRSAVALRGATAADLPAVIDLEVSGFPAREQWSPASWRAELEAADRIVLLATDPDDRSAVLGVITSLEMARRVVMYYEMTPIERYRAGEPFA